MLRATVRTDRKTADTSFCLGLGGGGHSYSFLQLLPSSLTWQQALLPPWDGLSWMSWRDCVKLRGWVQPSSLLQTELWSSHRNFSLWKQEATTSTFLRSTQYQIKSWKLEETKIQYLRLIQKTSLMLQWLRFHIPNAGKSGFDPWSGN